MNDEELAVALRSHNTAVIGHLIDTYSRLLWKTVSTVLRDTGGDAEAEECVADVFLALWERPEAFDPARGSLKSWLCMTARCKAIDRYRALTRYRTLPLESVVEAVSEDVPETVIREETRRLLAEAVNALDEAERDILLRRYDAGQKPGAIAAALGLSVKQVNNSLYRIKQKLRHALTQEKGDGI